MKSTLIRFVKEDHGQDIIEYSLLGAFISIVAWATLQTIGQDVSTIYTGIDTATGSAAAS